MMNSTMYTSKQSRKVSQKTRYGCNYRVHLKLSYKTRVKWGVLFEVSPSIIMPEISFDVIYYHLGKEVNRVLRPGGSVEVVEDGALRL